MPDKKIDQRPTTNDQRPQVSCGYEKRRPQPAFLA